MRTRIIASLAALALTAGSGAAVAAQPLSLANAPGVSSAESNLEGRGPGIYIVGAVVLGLVIWGVIELLDDGDNAVPNSP